MKSRFVQTLALVTVSTLLPLSASAHWCGGGSGSYDSWRDRYQTVCVKAWGSDYTWPATVSNWWADYLLDSGKAVEAGEYYRDADGDGFGDPNSWKRACPSPWRADNALDCNDEDASVHPEAADVCGDNVDNNCSGTADESCDGGTGECPCYTTAQIDAAYQAFAAEQWDDSSLLCEDWTYVGDGFSYDWAKLTWAGSLTEGGVTYSTSSLFYGVDYVDGDSATYCVRSQQSSELDEASGNYVGYDEDYYEQPLTAAQHQACVDVVLEYAAQANIACEVTNYP